VSTFVSSRDPVRPHLHRQDVPWSGGPSKVARVVARPRRQGTSATDSEFPEALAAWIARDGDMVEGLVALRCLGAEGTDAVQAVLSVRRVATLRASWQLWEALAEGDGEDPEDLLVRALPLHVVERARRALWGPSWRDASGGRPHGSHRLRVVPR
jgi:hypothetical protein